VVIPYFDFVQLVNNFPKGVPKGVFKKGSALTLCEDFQEINLAPLGFLGLYPQMRFVSLLDGLHLKRAGNRFAMGQSN
jgi:hypothetical protein